MGVDYKAGLRKTKKIIKEMCDDVWRLYNKVPGNPKPVESIITKANMGKFSSGPDLRKYTII